MAIPSFQLEAIHGPGIMDLLAEPETSTGCTADCVGSLWPTHAQMPTLLVECALHQVVVGARQFSVRKARALARRALQRIALRAEQEDAALAAVQDPRNPVAATVDVYQGRANPTEGAGDSPRLPLVDAYPPPVRPMCAGCRDTPIDLFLTEVEESAFVFVCRRGGRGCGRQFLSPESLETHLRQSASVCPDLTFIAR